MKSRNRIARKIKTIMTDAQRSRFPVLESFLWLVSAAYKLGSTGRAFCYDKGIFRTKQLPCRVISIGNLTVGGTGKTPMTIYLARLVRQLGFRVAVLSRGYKGRAEQAGGIVSDGRQIFMGPEESGDEPFMMAAQLDRIPVLVGHRRYNSGLLAIKRFAPDVIVLDDGFQHLQLFRDLNILLLDSRQPLGNHYLIPRGRLRESPAALHRADVCIFTRFEGGDEKKTCVDSFVPQGYPIFKTQHTPKTYIHQSNKGFQFQGAKPGKLFRPITLDSVRTCRVYGFSGIAQNNDFRKTVAQLFSSVKGFSTFPDHYPYRQSDIDSLLRKALDNRADLLVTTEKDYARVGHRLNWPLDVVYIGIDVSFGEYSDDFNRFIKKALPGPY